MKDMEKKLPFFCRNWGLSPISEVEGVYFYWKGWKYKNINIIFYFFFFFSF